MATLGRCNWHRSSQSIGVCRSSQEALDVDRCAFVCQFKNKLIEFNVISHYYLNLISKHYIHNLENNYLYN